jgi:dynactin complex subunit
LDRPTLDGLVPTLPLVVPTNQKSVPYLIYSVRTSLDAHVKVFQKAIQVNGERNDLNIINLFCFTLRDAISKWGENFMQSHLGCTFAELEVVFYKRYQKVQTNEHVYMVMKVIKQVMKEKVEISYELLLKLANFLNHNVDDNLFMTFF